MAGEAKQQERRRRGAEAAFLGDLVKDGAAPGGRGSQADRAKIRDHNDTINH